MFPKGLSRSWKCDKRRPRRPYAYADSHQSLFISQTVWIWIKTPSNNISVARLYISVHVRQVKVLRHNLKQYVWYYFMNWTSNTLINLWSLKIDLVIETVQILMKCHIKCLKAVEYLVLFKGDQAADGMMTLTWTSHKRITCSAWCLSVVHGACL